MPVISSTPAAYPALTTDPQTLGLLGRHLLAPSWQASTSFRVEITRSTSGEETRRLLHGRPNLSVRLPGRGLRDAKYHARTAARRRAQSRTPAPLFQDTRELTASASAGATSLTVEATAGHRFYVGGRAMLYRPDGNGVFTPEFVTISSVGTTTLGVSALAATWPAYSRVCPCIEADPAASISHPLLIRAVEQDTQLQEVVTSASLLTGLALGSIPASGFDTFDTLPVYRPNRLRDQSDFGATLGFDGYTDPLGPGRVYERRGRGVRERFAARHYCRTREEFWQLYQFYCGRGGELLLFWLVPPTHRLDLVAVDTGGTITVKALESLTDWTLIEGVALQTTSGWHYFKTSDYVVSASGGNHVLTFDGGELSGISGACGLYELVRCRFDGPFEESWLKRDNAQVSLTLVQAPADNNSVSVAVPELPEATEATVEAHGCTIPQLPLYYWESDPTYGELVGSLAYQGLVSGNPTWSGTATWIADRIRIGGGDGTPPDPATVTITMALKSGPQWHVTSSDGFYTDASFTSIGSATNRCLFGSSSGPCVGVFPATLSGHRAVWQTQGLASSEWVTLEYIAAVADPVYLIGYFYLSAESDTVKTYSGIVSYLNGGSDSVANDIDWYEQPVLWQESTISYNKSTGVWTVFAAASFSGVAIAPTSPAAPGFTTANFVEQPVPFSFPQSTGYRITPVASI